MAFYGGSDSSGDTARALQQEQQHFQNLGTKNINNAFSIYTPQFYQDRAKAYEGAALPALSSQYGQERKQLAYTLANRGLLSGSAANEQFTNLGNEKTRQQQNIANQGQAYAQGLQREVAGNKAGLMSQVMSGINPGGGATSAANITANTPGPNPWTPLTNFFSDFNNTLYNRIALSSLGTTSPTSNTAPVAGSSWSPNNQAQQQGNALAYTVK